MSSGETKWDARASNRAYKREAVAKAKTSGYVSQTARYLGISNKSLHEWIRQLSELLKIEETNAKELTARVRELEKQLSVREAQIDVLKKSYRDRQPGPGERFNIIEQERFLGTLSIADLCEALEVSPSGYYTWWD